MRIIIDDLTEEKRIDAYLADYMQDFSRAKIQTGIRNGHVLVNQKSVKPSYIIKENDLIDVNIQEKLPVIEPENIALDVVWEDENLAVINKPSGMLTHPTSLETTGTLVNALIHKYGDNLSDVNGDFRRGILHRLDRNTSGLIIIAKNNNAHNYLVQKMKQHEIVKKYAAVVKGIIEQDEFEINSPIDRNQKQPNKMTISENGKDALSKVKVLKRFKDATLLEVQIITGRTHQIRVHMSSIGHPVFNDTLYGFGKIKIKTEEQVLQSYKLTFPKPFDEAIISLEIPFDDKINKVIKALS